MQDKILLEIYFLALVKHAFKKEIMINKELLGASDSTLDVSNMKHIAFQEGLTFKLF